MDFIKKYAMIIVLVLVVIFFTIMTQGKMLLPQNISNLTCTWPVHDLKQRSNNNDTRTQTIRKGSEFLITCGITQF